MTSTINRFENIAIDFARNCRYVALMPLAVRLPDGRAGDPQCGVTPIFVQLEPGLLRVVGTGFYITRYGLLLTAKHVVEELAEHDAEQRPSLAWNWTAHGTLHLRRILTCSFLTAAPRSAADIAVCQAVYSVRNGVIQFDAPNERIAIVTVTPPVATHIGTYAYPGNASVDLRQKEEVVKLFADVFEGRILGVIGPDERFLRYEHVETSIQIRAGASGGPVFVPQGHAFAVNCRGWDFSGDDTSTPLSSVVPIRHILDLEIPMPHMQENSYEYQAVPPSRRGGKTTLRDLAAWNHLVIDPPAAA